jgi:hypothetical protein
MLELVFYAMGCMFGRHALDEPGAVEGEQILFRNRRFVLEKGLKQVPEFRAFKSEALGLARRWSIQIDVSTYNHYGFRFSLQNVTSMLPLGAHSRGATRCIGKRFIHQVHRGNHE